MAEDSEIKWGLAQRFEFVEWRAYWAGRLNRKDLEDEFGISTPQASTDLRRYQEAAPGNIEYDATQKVYLASEGFNPKFLKLSPERYLLQLQALKSGAIRKEDTWFDRVPPVDISTTMVRGAEAYTLRAIVKAIERGDAIPINYFSLTSKGMRTICPHALAHDGYRWHVRALSLERMEYRDYVLGRILSISPPVPCAANPLDDIAWQTEADLTLIAHPGLEQLQKETIEHDYRMQNGELVVRMRLALAFYFISRHNLDLREGQIKPERAQLFLKNYDEIKAAKEDAEKKSKALVTARLSPQGTVTIKKEGIIT